MSTTITLADLYKRQITLLGQKAFNKLRETKVLVVGLGGLGCPALQYLATSGIGEIGLCDFDNVDVTNLQRQILFSQSDIGLKKTHVAKAKLELLAPLSKIVEHNLRVDKQNISKLIQDYDYVLDCSDNFLTKFIIHDACFKQHKKLIQASVYKFEGQIHAFDFSQSQGPCLRCLWKNEPVDGCVGTCADVGVLGPLLGVIGSMQASIVINDISGRDQIQNEQAIFVDLQDMRIDKRKFLKNTECSLCVYHNFENNNNFQIPLPANIDDFQIIDLRSESERENCRFVTQIKNSDQILRANSILADDKKYLVICAKGIRSAKYAHTQRQFHRAIFSLIGGVSSIS